MMMINYMINRTRNVRHHYASHFPLCLLPLLIKLDSLLLESAPWP